MPGGMEGNICIREIKWHCTILIDIRRSRLNETQRLTQSRLGPRKEGTPSKKGKRRGLHTRGNRKILVGTTKRKSPAKSFHR